MEKTIPEVLYGDLSKTQKEKKSWGYIGRLFGNYGHRNINAFTVTFSKETVYSEWSMTEAENISVVEAGSGTIFWNGKEYDVAEGFAIKIFPGQKPIVKPAEPLTFYSVQMPAPKGKKFTGENLDELCVLNVRSKPDQVYEYESLGQEIITPAYDGGLGLLTFTFAIDKIPLHIHPNSDRIIRPFPDSGDGYTYAKPNIYQMNPDTYAVFPKGTIHTNGPVPGSVYKVYAFQLPWVESEITEKEIGGVPEFVTYVGETPPRELWKTKEDFYRVIERLSVK